MVKVTSEGRERIRKGKRKILVLSSEAGVTTTENFQCAFSGVLYTSHQYQLRFPDGCSCWDAPLTEWNMLDTAHVLHVINRKASIRM